MSKLGTQLNARSADFQANAQAMRAVVDDLRAQAAKNEQEMRVVMEDGRQRLTKLLTNPPKPAA